MNRRDFLKKLGLGAGAVAVAPSVLVGVPDAPNCPTGKVRKMGHLARGRKPAPTEIAYKQKTYSAPIPWRRTTMTGTPLTKEQIGDLINGTMKHVREAEAKWLRKQLDNRFWGTQRELT